MINKIFAILILKKKFFFIPKTSMNPCDEKNKEINLYFPNQNLSDLKIHYYYNNQIYIFHLHIYPLYTRCEYIKTVVDANRLDSSIIIKIILENGIVPDDGIIIPGIQLIYFFLCFYSEGYNHFPYIKLKDWKEKEIEYKKENNLHILQEIIEEALTFNEDDWDKLYQNNKLLGSPCFITLTEYFALNKKDIIIKKMIKHLSEPEIPRLLFWYPYIEKKYPDLENTYLKIISNQSKKAESLVEIKDFITSFQNLSPLLKLKFVLAKEYGVKEMFDENGNIREVITLIKEK